MKKTLNLNFRTTSAPEQQELASGTIKEKLITTSFQVDKNVYKQFRLWCVANDTNTTQFLGEAIKQAIGSNNVRSRKIEILKENLTTKSFFIRKNESRDLNVLLTQNDTSLKDFINTRIIDVLEKNK